MSVEENLFQSKKFYFIFFGIIILTMLILRLSQNRLPEIDVSLKGVKLHALVANTPERQQRGLGQRDNMAGFDAMVFPFVFPDRYGFVMRDMRFPIDIVWFNDGKVVDIAPNVPIEPNAKTEADLHVYYPRTIANTVVELPAGWSASHELKIGDILEGVENTP